MSEESPKNEININAIPGFLDDSAKNLLTPVTSEIGSFFSDVLYHLTGDVHLSAEKKRIKNEIEAKKFRADLENEILKKPKEVLTEPKEQVVGQAFDKVKNCLDEPSIRDMFKKLIANAADLRYQQALHPSFPSIIEQLSPLDAENLALFQSSRSYPIVNYKFENKKAGGEITTFNHFFLGNPNMHTPQDFILQASSLVSLQRMGLIEISYDKRLANESLYEPFKTTYAMEQCRQESKRINELTDTSSIKKNDNASFDKGFVSITPFGKDFIKVCL